LNTLVNFQSAQPSKTGQFSFGVNTLISLTELAKLRKSGKIIKEMIAQPKSRLAVKHNLPLAFL
jgi:hypothetical protein